MGLAQSIIEKIMKKKKPEAQTQEIESTIGDQKMVTRVPKSKKNLQPKY